MTAPAKVTDRQDKDYRRQYLPMQSHGVMVTKWIPPPPTRFETYTRSDESWAAYCGLGRYEDTLAPMYDVYDQDDASVLLGYCEFNPSHCRSFRMLIPHREEVRQGFFPFATNIKVTELRQELYGRYRPSLLVEYFSTWSCRPDEFNLLVAGGRAVKSANEVYRSAGRVKAMADRQLMPNIKAIFGTAVMLDKVFVDRSLYNIPIVECDSDSESFQQGYEYAARNGVTVACLQLKQPDHYCLTIDGAKLLSFRRDIALKTMPIQPAEQSIREDFRVSYSFDLKLR